MSDFFKLPKIDAFKIAEFTRTRIIDAIVSQTGLQRKVAESKISISGDSNSAKVILKATGIPIHNFQPTFQESSKSKASIFADVSMTAGVQRIRGAFRNPIAQINARRTSKKAYPIKPVYGPSVKTLFLKTKQSIFDEVETKIGENFSNG